jgi:hypothetical protein
MLGQPIMIRNLGSVAQRISAQSDGNRWELLGVIFPAAGTFLSAQIGFPLSSDPAKGGRVQQHDQPEVNGSSSQDGTCPET